MTIYKDFAEADRNYGNRFGEQVSIQRVGVSTRTQAPDFTVVDQTPNEIAKYKFYVESGSSKYAMVNAPAVEWYVLKGKRGILRPGDFITPTGATPFPSTTPNITYFNQLPVGICIGFKTQRLGAIYNGNTLLYNNIKFDYLPASAFPGTPLDREMEASLGVPSMQAVFFKRVLTTLTQDEAGLFLYQIDTTPNIIWEITNVVELRAGAGAAIQICDMKRNTIG